MIWIRSQFAKGLAEPSISTSQEYPWVWAISPFPQIDALHPLRYDLFLFSLLSHVPHGASGVSPSARG